MECCGHGERVAPEVSRISRVNLAFFLRDARLVSRALTYGSACSVPVDSVVHRGSHRVVITRGPECATERCLGGLFPFPATAPRAGLSTYHHVGGSTNSICCPADHCTNLASCPKRSERPTGFTRAVRRSGATVGSGSCLTFSERSSASSPTPEQKATQERRRLLLDAPKRCPRSGHGNRPFRVRP